MLARWDRSLGILCTYLARRRRLLQTGGMTQVQSSQPKTSARRAPATISVLRDPGTWQDVVGDIRQRQTELMRRRPWRDSGLVPNPSGRCELVDAAEARLGVTLPPSYRAFLTQTDGWPRFYEGASLLSSRELGKPEHIQLVSETLASCRAPSPAAAPSGPVEKKLLLLPFGIDAAGTTLFAFDLSTRREDGECEVVAWLNEVGVRRADFTSFMRLVLELCDSELEEERGAGGQRLETGHASGETWAQIG